MRTFTWRPEDNLGHHPCCLLAWSLEWDWSSLMRVAGWMASSWHLPISDIPALGFQCVPPWPAFLPGCGCTTPVLTHAGLSWLPHSCSILFNGNNFSTFNCCPLYLQLTPAALQGLKSDYSLLGMPRAYTSCKSSRNDKHFSLTA